MTPMVTNSAWPTFSLQHFENSYCNKMLIVSIINFRYIMNINYTLSLFKILERQLLYFNDKHLNSLEAFLAAGQPLPQICEWKKIILCTQHSFGCHMPQCFYTSRCSSCSGTLWTVNWKTPENCEHIQLASKGPRGQLSKPYYFPKIVTLCSVV